MLFLAALPLGLILLQSTQVVSSTDPLTLLSEVGQRYADAKSYHIEAVEEETIAVSSFETGARRS